MINVMTVHWKSAKWIEPQLRYLEQNVDAPFRVFAVLNGIDDRSMWDRFHYAVDIEGSHAEKLNALAGIVIGQSDPDDILMFLDGDAFPVRPLDAWMETTLASWPLAAVRRDENAGDRQPHPCFCITTCGFWQEIGGDWRKGGTWTNSLGDTTTDVGGNLLHLLADRKIDWLPLLRTNTRNEHPAWFGVYDHRVYHHGAGFRARVSRADQRLDRSAFEVGTGVLKSPTIEGLMMKAIRRPSVLAGVRPHHIGSLPQAARMSIAKQRHLAEGRRQNRQLAQGDPREQAVFARLLSDPEFYLDFDDTPG
jgi:hypothetical protein